MRSYWFKQRALWEYKARNKRNLTPSSAEMADEFPNFSLGIIEQFVFQLSCRKRVYWETSVLRSQINYENITCKQEQKIVLQTIDKTS